MSVTFILLFPLHTFFKPKLQIQQICGFVNLKNFKFGYFHVCGVFDQMYARYEDLSSDLFGKAYNISCFFKVFVQFEHFFGEPVEEITACALTLDSLLNFTQFAQFLRQCLLNVWRTW